VKETPGNSGSTFPDDSLSSKGSRSTTPRKPTNARCKTCGKLGHVSAVCPDTEPPAQVHAMMTDTDDTSVAGDASSIFILAHDKGESSIDPNFLLLNSESTINLFLNPKHVANMRPVAHPPLKDEIGIWKY
jgi:hypothetical protein